MKSILLPPSYREGIEFLETNVGPDSEVNCQGFRARLRQHQPPRWPYYDLLKFLVHC